MLKRMLAASAAVLALFVCIKLPRSVQAAGVDPWPYFDLKRSCGAVGNGVADDGPAFQSCFNQTTAIGGGTVYVPPGTYRVATPTNWIAGVGVYIMTGEGSASVIFAQGDPTSFIPFTITSMDSVVIERLLFRGSAPTTAGAFDALHIIKAGTSSLGGFLVRDSEFAATATYGSTIKTTNAIIERVLFGGVTAGMWAGQLGGAIEFNPIGGSAVVRDTVFLDYSNRGWSKTPEGVFAWIRALNGFNTAEAPSSGVLTVDGCRFDEGSDPVSTYSTTGRVAQVHITRVRALIPALGYAGFRIWNVDDATIDNSYVHTRVPQMWLDVHSTESMTIKNLRFNMQPGLGGYLRPGAPEQYAGWSGSGAYPQAFFTADTNSVRIVDSDRFMVRYNPFGSTNVGTDMTWQRGGRGGHILDAPTASADGAIPTGSLVSLAPDPDRTGVRALVAMPLEQQNEDMVGVLEGASDGISGWVVDSGVTRVMRVADVAIPSGTKLCIPDTTPGVAGACGTGQRPVAVTTGISYALGAVKVAPARLVMW